MILESVRVNGYKRFGDPAFLRPIPPVLAVVGPNESGKTSLLDAVAHLSRNGWSGLSEFTDRLANPNAASHANDDAIVSGCFVLEAEDVAALQEALRGRPFTGELVAGKTRYYVRKFADGKRYWGLDASIAIDPSPRSATADVLRKVLVHHDRAEFAPAAEHFDVEPVVARTEALLALLDGIEQRTTNEKEDAEIAQVAADLREWADATPGEEPVLAEAADAADDLAHQEARQPPRTLAGRALWARVPQCILFTSADRDLPSFTAFSAKPTRGLQNLLEAGGTDFEELEVLAGDASQRDLLRDTLNATNARLERLFSAWTQRGVSVAVHVDQHGVSIDGRDRLAPVIDSPIAQRSSGLRTFAALLAFVRRHVASDAPNRPVLLIDEAELHLHYDAQADLMRVLHRQDFAQAVVYTTHSLGCLPEDLGCGVVAVEEVGEERSRVGRSFWTGGAGMDPLVAALGATAVAFTPARRVVIGEGAHEAILLPRLFREVAGDSDDHLGFQIVGGLAQVSTVNAPALEEHAGTVVYLSDNDAGGRAHAKKVAPAATAAGRVVTLGEPGAAIEDFVDPNVLSEATATLIEKHTGTRPVLEPVPDIGRAAWLKAALEHSGTGISRTVVAQQLALRPRTDGIVDPKRADQLTAALAAIRRSFEAAIQR